MEPLAIVIFLGFPLAGLVVGLAVAGAIVAGWRSADPPESHYIASRVRAVPVAESEECWMRELDTLRLPYRHTIC